MKISCVLIEKSSTYPQSIYDRLNTGFFDECLIKTDCPSVYNRYLLAKHAKNDIIYFQDSDCFVNYQELFKKYDGRLTNTMTESFQRFYEPLGATLVGWGCFAPKSMLSIFDKYIAAYGEDEHLLREADRIFTYLNKPFNTIIMPHLDLPQASSGDRMTYEPHHFPSMKEAIRKCSLLV